MDDISLFEFFCSLRRELKSDYPENYWDFKCHFHYE